VLERAELTGEFDPAVFAWRKQVALRLRYLERVPLGTPYPDIVERVRRTTRAPELAGRRHVAVDATGVGRPVVDMLRNAGLGATTLPAIITGGAAEADEASCRRPERHDSFGHRLTLRPTYANIGM
jgi:hypothetical protein